jgi:hypothetical protein
MSRQTKYADLVVAAQLVHLQSCRVSVSDMVHAKVADKTDIILTGAGGLTVGDWVDVLHDFSPGHNSGGGVGVVIEIVEDRCNVRYIVDGHTERYIPIPRLTMIPMPFRREKSQLRTRSSKDVEKEKGTVYKVISAISQISNSHCDTYTWRYMSR